MDLSNVVFFPRRRETADNTMESGEQAARGVDNYITTPHGAARFHAGAEPGDNPQEYCEL